MNVPREPRRHLTAPPWRSSRTEAQVPVDVDEAHDTANDRGPGDVIVLSSDEVEQALDVFPVERAPVLLVNEAPLQDIVAANSILELAPPDEYAVETRDLVLEPTPRTRRFRTSRALPRPLNRHALIFALVVGLGGVIGVAINNTLREVQPNVVQAPAVPVPVDTTAKVTTSQPPDSKVVEPPPGERRAIPDSASAIAAVAADAAPTRSDYERPVSGERQRTVEPPVKAAAPQPVAQTITPSVADAALAIATNVPVVVPEPVPPAPPTAASRAVETLPSAPEPVAAPPEPVAAPTNVAAALSEPPPVAPLPPPRLTETGAIHNVLKQYQSAFNDLDARAAREIWPSVDARLLDRAFAQLETQQLEFDRCDIDVNGARAVAACGGRTRYVPKLGNKNPQAQRRQWTFDLRKVKDAWLIEGVDSR